MENRYILQLSYEDIEIMQEALKKFYHVQELLSQRNKVNGIIENIYKVLNEI